VAHRTEEMTMYKANVSSVSPSPAAEPLRAGTSSGSRAEVSSWYSKVASAWGAALDRQAQRTVHLSQQLSSGNDGPGAAMQVSAAAHQLTFLSTAASNVSNSIGEALQTLGRKQ
jgi:hypothetical protein